MKSQTYDLISEILGGIFIIILCLLGLALIFLPVKYAVDNHFREDCISQNKTYLDVSMIDGIPIKIKYCGNLNEIKEILKELKEIK